VQEMESEKERGKARGKGKEKDKENISLLIFSHLFSIQGTNYLCIRRLLLRRYLVRTRTS
jgi:hypothetical protein